MKRFTVKYIDALQAEDKRYEEREQDGFGVRVYPSGVKSWTYIYDFEGKRRRMTLGKYPPISLKDARQLHLEARTKVVLGSDPGARAIARKQERRKALRVNDIVKEYRSYWQFDHLAESSKKSYGATYDNELIPALGSVRAAEVTRADIRRILDRIIARSAPIQAKRSKSHIHRLFNYALEMDYIPYNPCSGIKLPIEEHSRERFLVHDEIKLFWMGLDHCTFAPMYKLALKLMLVTGQRKGEICKARWTDVDWENATWTIPEEVAKNRTRHVVYLSSLALDILHDLHSQTGKTSFFLPSPKNFRKHVYPSSVDQALHRSFDKFGVGERFTPHDLRRTMATNLDALRVPVDLIKGVLNHSLNRGVTAVYTQQTDAQGLQNAMESWSVELRRILGLPSAKRRGRNIIPLVQRNRRSPKSYRAANTQGGA